MDKIILQKKSTNTWANKIYKILISYLYLIFWLFGLYPFTKSYIIYQIYMLLWCSEIILATYYAFKYDIFGDEHSLNGLISTILYVAYIGGHLAVLAESWMMRKYRTPLHDQFLKLHQRLESQLLKPLKLVDTFMRISIIIFIFSLLLLFCHGLIIWTTFETKSSSASLLYWRTFPSFLALQFKSLEFLIAIVQINHYIVMVRKIINDMGERNLKRVFHTLQKSKKPSLIYVVPCHHEGKDEMQIEILKTSYNDLYATFQLLNRAYGWSLLASTSVYFVDFVCNTFWILLSVISQGRKDYYVLLQSVSFALMAFTLLSMVCWLCEESNYESRYIGCLISKLVKPLGNKHYNDLVSEFSVQTLHQRFVITAKEFFSLNLNLLGSMVAATVTYLVILIQFMFTEISNNESKLTTKTFVSISSSSTSMSPNDTALSTTVQSLVDNITDTVMDAV